MESIDPLAMANIENMELITEIHDLKADLAKYGGHTDECDSHKTYCVTKSNPVPYRGTCDCGWEK